MLPRLLRALTETANEAADDVLLEALSVGAPHEQPLLLDALIARRTTRGLGGVIERFDALADELQRQVIANIKPFHHALRECGRSDRKELRLAALRLIAIAHQGKLAYVVSENLHDADEQISKTAVEAMVALARWVASATRALQKNVSEYTGDGVSASDHADTPSHPHSDAYHQLIDNRPEIEASVARAIDVHRGRHGTELLRAALLLCDGPQSRTLAILHTTKHGGQGAMVRRLQQPPASEHVEAFLLGATHGGLRSHFGVALAHVDEAPVLDALLRKTHWLKDHHLQVCMHQVTRGAWWDPAQLARDLERRTPAEACMIGEWVASSGMHDVLQDQRLQRLSEHARDDFDARLRLLRIAVARKRGASVQLINAFLADPDERLVRMAAREIVRRKPMDFENVLLQQMIAAPASVRRVISRAIGQAGFEQFWQRFDRMDKDARRSAGRAMLKLLPDAVQRLARRLGQDPVDQRVKALQIVQELGLVEQLRAAILPLCNHPHAKVRSKAISAAGDVRGLASDVILDKVVGDADPRVRANAIEAMEASGAGSAANYAMILATRARSSHSRERANAIKGMHRLRVSTASAALMQMLRDARPEHRISGLWALRQIGWWHLLNQVGLIAKQDNSLRVRRYALNILKGVAEQMGQAKGKAS